MAQHIPDPSRYQRVPIMDGRMLDDRTRPSELRPVPIWLGHRLRAPSAAASAPRRARAWLRQLAGPFGG